MRIAISVAILAVIAMTAEARAETVHLYAAGSLRAAEIAAGAKDTAFRLVKGED